MVKSLNDLECIEFYANAPPGNYICYFCGDRLESETSYWDVYIKGILHGNDTDLDGHYLHIAVICTSCGIKQGLKW